MKKLLLTAIVVFIAFSAIACSGAPTATPKPQVTVPAIKVTNRIVAEGKVVPARSAALSFQINGLIAQVPVTVGMQVKAGQIIAQLDSKQIELQVAQAEANLATAQARLALAKRGPTAEDTAAAQQAVKSAQAAYDKLLKPDINEVTMAKADLDKAQVAVKQAQAAYDAIGGDSHPFAGMLPQRQQLQNAYLDLQKAQAAYNAKVTPSDTQIQQALSDLQSAKNRLAKLTPTAEDIAVAEANVKASQAARDLEADQLVRTKLVAPFDGTIASLEIKPGESAVVGTPVVRIADFTTMQIETTDLTELNVVNVKVGDSATITLDAIPDLEFTGKVTSIKGFGDNKQGDIVYALVISLDKQDPRLRWNMTAKVTLSK